MKELEFTLCAFLPEASTGDDPGLHVVVSFHSQKISLLLLEMPNAGGCQQIPKGIMRANVSCKSGDSKMRETMQSRAGFWEKCLPNHYISLSIPNASATNLE